MSNPHRVLLSSLRQWLKEPLVHFFAIGAALFVAHAAFAGEERTIRVTPAVKAGIARHLQDQNGRQPTSAELTKALADWKRDEALYREALREGVEREDATVRRVLADRLRARAALQIAIPEPSVEQLERWLETHRSLYETPPRYDYELLTFPKTAAGGRELEHYENALAAGTPPDKADRPLLGGTHTLVELREKFGASLAEAIAGLAQGRWQQLESADQWTLVRVKRTVGGLPSVEELRPRLIADWSRVVEKRAVESAVQQIVDRYHFEERP
jgi:hypothetical protein